MLVCPCLMADHRLGPAEAFPREKTAILIMWNNHLKLPGEDKRIN